MPLVLKQPWLTGRPSCGKLEGADTGLCAFTLIAAMTAPKANVEGLILQNLRAFVAKVRNGMKIMKVGRVTDAIDFPPLRSVDTTEEDKRVAGELTAKEKDRCRIVSAAEAPCPSLEKVGRRRDEVE